MKGNIKNRLARNLAIKKSTIPNAGEGLFAYKSGAAPGTILFTYGDKNHPEHPAPGLICPYVPDEMPLYISGQRFKKETVEDMNVPYVLQIGDKRASADYYANPWRKEEGYARYANDPTWSPENGFNKKLSLKANAILIAQDSLERNGVKSTLPRLPNRNPEIQDKNGKMLDTVMSSWLAVKRGKVIKQDEEIFTVYTSDGSYWQYDLEDATEINKRLEKIDGKVLGGADFLVPSWEGGTAAKYTNKYTKSNTIPIVDMAKLGPTVAVKHTGNWAVKGTHGKRKRKSLHVSRNQYVSAKAVRRHNNRLWRHQLGTRHNWSKMPIEAGGPRTRNWKRRTCGSLPAVKLTTKGALMRRSKAGGWYYAPKNSTSAAMARQKKKCQYKARQGIVMNASPTY
jgi:hypothetical protein